MKKNKPDGLYYNSRGQVVRHCGYSTRIEWNPQMISYLVRMYPNTKNEELCNVIGVSQRTMIRKARELGLEKDSSWLHKTWDNNRIQAHIYSRIKGYPGCFKKGQHANPAGEFKPKKQPQHV